MSERIRPVGDAPDHPASPSASPPKELHLPPPGPEGKPQPAPGTYVIQVPKEQIFRTPTPETERRFKRYTRRSGRGRRSCCCCCLFWLTGLLLAIAATAGVLYLVFRPQLPKYAIDSVTVRGFNLTSDTTPAPEFDVAVRAENPNRKVRISYVGGGLVAVSHSGVDLCSGVWPAFYQGARNVTVVRTALLGSGIHLSGTMRRELAAAQERGEVPLQVRARVPVKVKFGAVTIDLEDHCQGAVRPDTRQVGGERQSGLGVVRR